MLRLLFRKKNKRVQTNYRTIVIFIFLLKRVVFAVSTRVKNELIEKMCATEEKTYPVYIYIGTRLTR